MVICIYHLYHYWNEWGSYQEIEELVNKGTASQPNIRIQHQQQGEKFGNKQNNLTKQIIDDEKRRCHAIKWHTKQKVSKTQDGISQERILTSIEQQMEQNEQAVGMERIYMGQSATVEGCSASEGKTIH